MKFYQVKPEYDNTKLSKSWEILVGTELLTPAEYNKALVKYANRNNMRHVLRQPSESDRVSFAAKFDIVNVKKNQTCWLFGARFARKEG